MTDNKRPDTPLAETPDMTKPVTDLRTALADINNRAAIRQKSIDDSNKKLEDARIARSKKERTVAGDGGRLYGLASFSSTTGKNE